MKIFQEFKEFAIKGNVVDLAIGVIIGGAFGKIVSSLVGDIIMPPLGILLGGINLRSLVWVLARATASSPAVVINYGLFFQNVIDFLIVAGAVFLLVKAMNKLRRKKEILPPPPPRSERLLEEIRDLLKNKI